MKESDLTPDYLRGGLAGLRSVAPDDYLRSMQQMGLIVAMDRLSKGQPLRFTWEEYKEAFLRLPEGQRSGMGFQMDEEGITIMHAEQPQHPLAAYFAAGEDDAEEGVTQ